MNPWSVEYNIEYFLTIFVITFGRVQQQSNSKVTAKQQQSNSKATPNLPKIDDKNRQEVFNIVFNWSEVFLVKKYLLKKPYFKRVLRQCWDNVTVFNTCLAIAEKMLIWLMSL